MNTNKTDSAQTSAQTVFFVIFPWTTTPQSGSWMDHVPRFVYLALLFSKLLDFVIKVEIGHLIPIY